MKKFKITGLLMLFMVMVGLNANAQDKKEKRPSPPKSVSATINGGEVVIDYSSPSVKGRTIYGDLVPYGKVWRTGANEATTIMFENDVTVKGEAVPAGKYSLFTIPTEKEWTVILNSEWDQWGAYNVKEKADVLRFQVTPEATKENVEKLVFAISDNGVVTMMWADQQISFEVK